MVTLDESQLSFCTSTESNIRLLAPAGCGKTTALLYRCKELILGSATKPRFLIVTFTKAAAAELQDRIQQDPAFVDLDGHVRITTLNAYGWQRIRDHGLHPRLLSTQKDFHFAMRNQMRPVWEGKSHLAEVIGKSSTAPRRVMTAMDNLKSMGFDHTRDTNRDRFEEHLQDLHRQGLTWRIEEQFELLTRLKVLEPTRQGSEEGPATSVRKFYDRFFTFWREGTEFLLGQSTFTFEDQKYWTYLDLKSPGPDGKEKPHFHGAARYDHILVDEFQDVNPLDIQLVRVLAERNQASLTIVGDDDQAIFEWRGASPKYILEPAAYLGIPFKDYVLSTNYRSPGNVVDLSQQLISNNKGRVPKPVAAADAASTAEIKIEPTASMMDRLRLVTEIARSVTDPGKVAVIGRQRRHLIPYEIYFADDGAPFKTATDLDIFDSGAFDQLVKLLDLWNMAENKVRTQQATDGALDICDLIKRYPLNKKDRASLSTYVHGRGPRTVAAAIEAIAAYDGPKLRGKSHLQLHETATAFVESDAVAEALRVIDKGFQGMWFDADKAEEDAWYIAPPLEQIAQMAEESDMDADVLIERLETAKQRLRDYRAFEDNPSNEEETSSLERVLERPLHLMTATRAKGKEFDTVILLDTMEGVWPHPRSATDERELEAERRLFYVAFTRARRRVIMLTTPDAPISRFVTEMGLDA